MNATATIVIIVINFCAYLSEVILKINRINYNGRTARRLFDKKIGLKYFAEIIEHSKKIKIHNNQKLQGTLIHANYHANLHKSYSRISPYFFVHFSFNTIIVEFCIEWMILSIRIGNLETFKYIVEALVGCCSIRDSNAAVLFQARVNLPKIPSSTSDSLVVLSKRLPDIFA